MMRAALVLLTVALSSAAGSYISSVDPYYFTSSYSIDPTNYPTPYIATPYIHTIPFSSQYHSQDIFGNVISGHSTLDQTKEEIRDFDGTVRGSYSFIDPHGKVNKVIYKAGKEGFKVLGANNLPVAPEDTPEVKAAKSEFKKKFEEAKKKALEFPDREEQRLHRRRRSIDEETLKKDRSYISYPSVSVPFYDPYLTSHLLVKSDPHNLLFKHSPEFTPLHSDLLLKSLNPFEIPEEFKFKEPKKPMEKEDKKPEKKPEEKEEKKPEKKPEEKPKTPADTEILGTTLITPYGHLLPSIGFPVLKTEELKPIEEKKPEKPIKEIKEIKFLPDIKTETVYISKPISYSGYPYIPLTSYSDFTFPYSSHIVPFKR